MLYIFYSLLSSVSCLYSFYILFSISAHTHTHTQYFYCVVVCSVRSSMPDFPFRLVVMPPRDSPRGVSTQAPPNAR